jgi:hypothetical protein
MNFPRKQQAASFSTGNSTKSSQKKDKQFNVNWISKKIKSSSGHLRMQMQNFIHEWPFGFTLDDERARLGSA